MTTPKLSEVFRLAATILAPQDDYESVEPGITYYEHSCPAISDAYAMLSGEDYDVDCPARLYYPLWDVPYLYAFVDIPHKQRQGARFLWLCLLAEIAESEGN
jgi:hypothetical protein